MSSLDPEPGKCSDEGPQSALERKLIDEYLTEKGYHLSDLQALPEREARRLMREACRYASLKLAEVESRAQLRKEIHYPS
jgi:hypothetical protein